MLIDTETKLVVLNERKFNLCCPTVFVHFHLSLFSLRTYSSRYEFLSETKQTNAVKICLYFYAKKKTKKKTVFHMAFVHVYFSRTLAGFSNPDDDLLKQINSYAVSLL